MGWSEAGQGAGEGAIAGAWGGPVGMAIGAGIGAIGSIWGSKIQAHAAENAAQKQADANAATLAFQKQQAENTYQNQETTRKANYDQWAARQQAMNKTRVALGLAPQDIPAYVPGIDPHLDVQQPYVGGVPRPGTSPEAQANYAAWVARQPPGGPTQQSAFAPPGSTPNPSATPSGTTANPQSYFNSLFPGQTLTPEQLASQESNLNAHGIKLLRNAAGRAGKIQLADGTAIDVIYGAGSGQNIKQWLVQTPSGAPPTTTSPIARNVGSYLQPNDQIGIAPGVLAPPSPFQPFSVGSYF